MMCKQFYIHLLDEDNGYQTWMGKYFNALLLNFEPDLTTKLSKLTLMDIHLALDVTIIEVFYVKQ